MIFGTKVYRTMADMHQLLEVIWCGNDVVTGNGVIQFDPRIWAAMLILPKLASQFPNFVFSYCVSNKVWGHGVPAQMICEEIVAYLRSKGYSAGA